MKKESSTRQPAEARGPALVETQPGTPIPMQGRQNKFMQTEEIMKELLHFGEGSDAQCQTEPFTNRPPRPFLITAKTGFDMATQVLPEEVRAWKSIQSALLSIHICWYFTFYRGPFSVSPPKLFQLIYNMKLILVFKYYES